MFGFLTSIVLVYIFRKSDLYGHSKFSTVQFITHGSVITGIQGASKKGEAKKRKSDQIITSTHILLIFVGSRFGSVSLA